MGLGSVAAARGDSSAAQKYLREAVANAMTAQQPPLVMAALLGLAEMVAARGEKAQAMKMLAVVLQEGATESQTRERAAELWSQLSGGAAREGRWRTDATPGGRDRGVVGGGCMGRSVGNKRGRRSLGPSCVA